MDLALCNQWWKWGGLSLCKCGSSDHKAYTIHNSTPG